MLPHGLASGTVLSYDIINLGPNQVATRGTFNTTAASPASDTWGTAVSSPTTAPTFTVGTDVFGTISAAAGSREWFCFVAARTGSHTLWVGWNDGSDIDAVLTNAAGTAGLLTRATLANPETGSVNLTSGTRYCVLLEMYEAATAGESLYRIRIQ